MSTATLAPEPLAPTPVDGPDLHVTPRRGRLSRFARWLLGSVLGILLCTTLPTALIVVGWTFRSLRRNLLADWARRAGAELDLATLVPAPQRAAFAVNRRPRWLIAERFAERLSAPTATGEPPGRFRRLLRLPAALTAGFRANLGAGLTALACTAVLTLPGCLLMLGGWEYGWNISFYKGYEQAFVGRTVAFVGALMLAAAMLYVPAAWAHLAAAGEPRAFFQFRLVGRLIAVRLGAWTLYALAFVVLSLPVSGLWMVQQGLPNIFPDLETMDRAGLEDFAFRFRLLAALVLFPTYVGLHRLAGRIYGGAVLALVARDPSQTVVLPKDIAGALEQLGLIPEGSSRRRHPVLRVILGTGRRGTRAVLWVASFLIWFLVPFQLLVMQFFFAHPFLVWLNPMLVHLPCLPIGPNGG